MKLCPLKFNSKTINADNISNNVEYKCEEEECAWYDTKYNDCAMLLLGVGVFNK